jgi:hypothetical protein
MPLNFPNTPTIGQTASYNNGNVVYWTGDSWRSYSSGLTQYGTASISFGFNSSNEGDTATASVSTIFVKSNSIIVINTTTSIDHESIEDSLIEDIKYEIGDKVAGSGFTIYAYAPQGTWGEYIIEYKIIN